MQTDKIEPSPSFITEFDNVEENVSCLTPQNSSERKPLLIEIRSLFNSIPDDRKLGAFIHYCHKSTPINESKKPRWVVGNASFFKTINIVPKEWQERFDFPIDVAEEIAKLFLKADSCFEKETCRMLKNQIESVLSDCNITQMILCELTSSIRKLNEMSSRIKVGKPIVSSAINDLLDVVSSSFGTINLNSDDQLNVCLSDELPLIKVQNDGYLHNKEITFLLKGDNAFNEPLKWYQKETDCHKLIICMKSLLRENMQKFAFKKEEQTKYSKVMGISYLQKVVYLFILEVNFEEVNDQNGLLIVPKYSIYMKQYSLLPVQILKLFLDIVFFIHHYVPKHIGSSMKPFRPSASIDTALLNQIRLLDLLKKTITSRD